MTCNSYMNREGRDQEGGEMEEAYEAGYARGREDAEEGVDSVTLTDVYVHGCIHTWDAELLQAFKTGYRDGYLMEKRVQAQ